MKTFEQFLTESGPSEIIARIAKEITSKQKAVKIAYEYRPANEFHRHADFHAIIVRQRGKLLDEFAFEDSQAALKKIQELRSKYVDFMF